MTPATALLLFLGPEHSVSVLPCFFQLRERGVEHRPPAHVGFSLAGKCIDVYAAGHFRSLQLLLRAKDSRKQAVDDQRMPEHLTPVVVQPAVVAVINTARRGVLRTDFKGRTSQHFL